MNIKHDVATLLNKVPKAPGDTIPSGATDDQIGRLEDKLGFALPNEFKDWLKLSNGPCVGPGGLYGTQTARVFLNIEGELELHPEWRSTKFVPVASDGCGNYYVMAVGKEYGEGGAILFIDSSEDPNRPAYVVASNIWSFLLFLLNKELGENEWPFSKAFVLERDPAILHCRNAPFPWG